MKKLHLMCLAYNTLEMTKTAIELCESQLDGFVPESKTIVDPSYPLGEQPMHSQVLMHIAESNGWKYIEPLKNYGVSGNWNWIARELGLGEGQVLIGIDPDARPQQTGWVRAALDVFNNAPECYYVGLNREEIYKQPHGQKEKQIGSTFVLDYPHLISWSCGGFDMGWMNKIGGIGQDHPVYAYIEAYVANRCNPLGGKFYMLRDKYDHHLSAPDAQYQQWKLECAQLKTTKDFAEWLKEKALI